MKEYTEDANDRGEIKMGPSGGLGVITAVNHL